MIYIACPYSHEESSVEEFRFDKVSEFAGLCIKQGEQVFSPITHGHPMHVRVELSNGWAFWQKYDLWFLCRCSLVRVLCLEGWKESEGVTAEIEAAKSLEIPIEYYDGSFRKR